jgi:hypothetical protein
MKSSQIGTIKDQNKSQKGGFEAFHSWAISSKKGALEFDAKIILKRVNEATTTPRQARWHH